MGRAREGGGGGGEEREREQKKKIRYLQREFMEHTERHGREFMGETEK